MLRCAFGVALTTALMSLASHAWAGDLDLTGEYGGDGHRLLIRQNGAKVWWMAQGKHLGGTYINVFRGDLTGDRLTGDWADLPPGEIQQSGAMTLKVTLKDGGIFFKKEKETGGPYGGEATEWSLRRIGAPVRAADLDKDPFAEGSVWVGDFRMAIKEAKVQKWALTVRERKAGGFEGEILIKHPDGGIETLKVRGVAPVRGAGAVQVSTELKGFQKVEIRGKLTNGEIALVFVGTDKLGRQVAGAATLKPKN